MRNQNGFTLIELLIVISIIAILAAAIIPNFIGFDVEARLSTTRVNLDVLRTRISLFRAKEGKYPDSLKDLLEKVYVDAGVNRQYLDKMPLELISSKSGDNKYVDMLSGDSVSTEPGGWVYYTDTAKVCVNIAEPLDKKWAEASGQKPIEW